MQPKTVEVIYVRDLERTVRFYQALGFVLAEENHEGCPTHYSVNFGPYLLWEFYPTKNTASSTSPSKERRLFVEVADFETILKICGELELTREPVIYHDMEHRLRSVVVRDPDGWRIHVREVSFEASPPVH